MISQIFSENAAWKARLDAQLKEGISDDLLCSIGFERESDGVYSVYTTIRLISSAALAK